MIINVEGLELFVLKKSLLVQAETNDVRLKKMRSYPLKSPELSKDIEYLLLENRAIKKILLSTIKNVIFSKTKET